jgi:asparagine synthase (glutamine-hydrolysing)
MRIGRFGPERFRDVITPMMWHFEGPLGGLMICALDEVVRACRDEGFIVLQDGSGLDECFAGYRNHHNLYVGTLLKAGDKAADSAVAEYAANWDVDENAVRKAALTELERAGTTVDGSIPVRPELLDPALLTTSLGHVPPSPHTGDPVHDALIDYLQVRKIPRNTRMYDRLSMAYGLELRLPFLDRRLVEFSLSIPSSLYFVNGHTKGIVREAMKGMMDDDVRIARKRSIQAPQGAWLMREPMRSYVEELLDSESFADRGLFDVPKAKAAFARFCQGAFDNSFFVWQWINTEEWYRMFIDGDPLAIPQPLCPSLQRPLPALAAEPVLQ